MTRVVHQEAQNFTLAQANAPLRKKKSRLKRGVFILGLLVFLVVGSVAIVYQSAPNRFNILLVGSDQRGTERARSDVLLLVSIPKKANEPVVLLTIPRDTKVQDPDFGLQKITHFYAFGERPDEKVLGNIDLTKAVIERELGISIQATIEVTFASFSDLINQVGGVTISSGDLNGEQALAVVRDRYRPGGDFARTADQREIVQSLMQKLSSLNLLDQVYSYLSTNQQTRLHYSQNQLIHFAVAYLLGHHFKLQLPTIQDEVLPGAGTSIYTPDFGKALYYYELDKEGTNTLLNTFIRP